LSSRASWVYSGSGTFTKRLRRL